MRRIPRKFVRVAQNVCVVCGRDGRQNVVSVSNAQRSLFDTPTYYDKTFFANRTYEHFAYHRLENVVIDYS